MPKWMPASMYTEVTVDSKELQIVGSVFVSLNSWIDRLTIHWRSEEEINLRDEGNNKFRHDQER